MFDPWIVGNSPDSGRTYVVHSVWPRFFLEIIEGEHDIWRPGALVWIDDPGTKNAAIWSAEAGKVYFAAIQSGRSRG